jgi:hypothetical protein
MNKKEYDEEIYQSDGGNPDFSGLIGMCNYSGIALTKEKYEEWDKNPDKELYCIFCQNPYPMGTTVCHPCKEYKGIMPFIEGWSD